MEAYSSLITQVLNVPALNRAIDMVNVCPQFTDTINLVTPSWEKRLENYAPYQDFKNHAKSKFKDLSASKIVEIQHIKDSEHPIKILVLANCLISRPFQSDTNAASNAKPGFSILVRDSVVLHKLCSAMTSDVDPSIHLADDQKFFMNSCSSWGCFTCQKSYELFQKAQIQIPSECQPCIAKTKIFNGEQIVNRFWTQLKDMFQGPFMAILHIQLNSRYFFTKDKEGVPMKTVKVGGNILNMIAFNESKLNPLEQVFLGDLNAALATSDDFKNSDAQNGLFIPPDDCKSVEEENIKTEIQHDKRTFNMMEDEDMDTIIEAFPKNIKTRGQAKQKRLNEDVYLIEDENLSF